ncbi:MAG: arylsulfatase A-like enzyme [Planctomycetota bacterium]|jgi:arylsulfatase A-like enzyme
MSKPQPSRRQLLKGAGAIAIGRLTGDRRDPASASASSTRQTRDEGQGAADDPPRRRPNVLFIIDDQHRFDVLGAAGDKMAHTPALDGLASRGLRFTDVYCQVPLCVPARQSLLTATYAHQHTTFGNVVQEYPEDQATLAGHLRKHGYQTAMIGKSHFNHHEFEVVYEKGTMARKFDRRHPQGVHPGSHAMKSQLDDFPMPLRSANPHYLPASKDAEQAVFRMEEEVVARSRTFLDERDSERPFFLWASLVSPHPPRFPPKQWLDQYRDADVPLPAALTQASYDALFSFHRALITSSGMSRISRDQLRNLVRAYYASVAWSDYNIGLLLAELEARGLTKDTLVVYTSDHGEALGEHGLMGKVTFFEGPQRVPLILSHPDLIGAASVSQRVVTHLDLMTSLPELLQIPAFDPAQGRSLMPLLKPSKTSSWEDVAIAELYLGEKNFEQVPGSHLSVMLRQRDLKYVEGIIGEAALFDLASDPHETRDLIKDVGRKGDLEEILDRVHEHKPEQFYARVTRVPQRLNKPK